MAEMVGSLLRRDALGGTGTEGIQLPVALAYAIRRSRGLVFAQEVLVQAGEKFPECATIHFNLACYAAQLGHLDEARLRLCRAIHLDRGFADLAKTDPDLKPIRAEIA
jgi:hypothetical protein